MWQVTSDIWHVTHDMWHMTCDTWNVTYRGWWTLSQNFSSLALTVWELWFFEDIEEKDESVTYPFSPNLQNIINPKLLELGTWNFETMFTTPCVSWVNCHVSCVMCHVSHVTCHLSHDIITHKLLELGSWNFAAMFANRLHQKSCPALFQGSKAKAYLQLVSGHSHILSVNWYLIYATWYLIHLILTSWR